MKIYKEAMINLNEALILYLELQKIFKDEETVLFSPRVMLFIETIIFQTIMYNIVQAVRISSKENACGWLILKIFETSPFIFPTIHLECSNIIQSCLKYPDKNNRHKDKYKKVFNKISGRLIVRRNNSRKAANINDKYNNNSSMAGSNPSSSIKGYASNLRSSSRSIDFTTLKGLGSYVTHKKENYYKNKTIILCVSEKIVPRLNGMEIKDVLIKFFQKCFINNETDKFGFIQFSNNGKKTKNGEESILHVPEHLGHRRGMTHHHAVAIVNILYSLLGLRNLAFIIVFPIHYAILLSLSKRAKAV